MYCTSCGKKYSEGDRFCPGCGAKIGEHTRSPAIRDSPSKPKPTLPKLNDEQIGCAIMIVIALIWFGYTKYDDYKRSKKFFDNYRNNPNQFQRNQWQR